ncbi:MAG TPA: N-acetyltransferase [Candidatus Sulfotelmatobacter sp.]|nr:N-acetyltransferase [Candidatus Sulfotelmatobacter sp.]
MSSSIRIASACADDYRQCAAIMAGSEPWLTLQRDFEQCRVFLDRPGTELFVAWEGSRLAGFLLLAAYGFAGSPYVASIGVAAEARGQGIGSQLLRFAENRFADRRTIFLLVSSFNHRAQKLYRRLGYEFVGELKDYLVPGHSELILQKRIS